MIVMRVVKSLIKSVLAVIIMAVILSQPLSAEEKPSIIVHLDNLYRIWFTEQYPTMNVDLWMQTDTDIKGASMGFIIRNPLVEIDTVVIAEFFRETPLIRTDFKNDTVLAYGDTASYFHVGLVQFFANSITPKNKFMKLATCRISLRTELFEDYPDRMVIWFDSTKIGHAGDFMLTTPDGINYTPSDLYIDTTFIFRKDFDFKRPPVRKGISAVDFKYRFLLSLPKNIYLH